MSERCMRCAAVVVTCMHAAIDKIEAILVHPDPKLYECANHVVERYFQWSDEAEATDMSEYEGVCLAGHRG